MMSEHYISDVSGLLQISGVVCDHFDESDKPLKITIKSAGKRSLSQNALMWLWYGELCTQIKRKSGDSYSTDDLHEYFKGRFCPAKELKFGDKVIHVTSTTRLDKGEMQFFMNQVHEWSVNAGFTLTTPIKSEYREIIERMSS